MRLTRLTKFYKDEEAGLPHTKAELWELAYELSEVMQDHAANCKLPSTYDDLDEFLAELKAKPTSVLIDTAVNVLHQALLEYADEDYELTFRWLSQDIVAYLLSRNGGQQQAEARAWAEAEEQKEADLDALEEAYWQQVDAW